MNGSDGFAARLFKADRGDRLIGQDDLAPNGVRGIFAGRLQVGIAGRARRSAGWRDAQLYQLA
jgi:hypothetical protein